MNANNANNVNSASEPKVKPVHEIRLGAVKAAIWANPTNNGSVFHSVVLSRIYKDEAGAWQESRSLNRDDLLLAGKVLDRAHSWVCDTARKPE